MYRLHIDIPLGDDEQFAQHASEHFVEWISDPNGHPRAAFGKFGVQEVNCRLGNDEDRQKSNYLDVNENGHTSNKKTRIRF